MKGLKEIFLVIGICIVLSVLTVFLKKEKKHTSSKIGNVIDNLNGVKVYYNGPYSNILGRNWTKDHYNLGLKYQCVEFVKRYYYENLNHKMPESYGNAKDFFDKNIKDGAFNKKRALNQYSNSSKSKPKVNDLLIFSGTVFNKYGHVAIISKVKEDEIEIIQQNAGLSSNSRLTYSLIRKTSKWSIDNHRVLGWLRKE
ncbi:CHAP domain-containing protein [Flavobacterium sp. K5-23]|uniref:CHAP domain-containing protein n=1 Tax=Flavobacterium sp. K5-23 TaxID=2746225 RepID=UPI00201088CA|nr:CHAP domain-containing protein [Flavobacterium sp. K5-23]UQD57233.1 CHAP domain-containing protein [Flavobacterium sp. K5-23]